ncbi:MAG: flippase [Anaerolineales bacterium]|nr:flippase [Anaerolineales bacterium]
MQPTTDGARHTGRRVLVNTGALTGASLYRIGMSFVLQLLIARRLGVDALGHYTIAMAYLNVSQVLSELGLPSLLVRDLAQSPWRRRSYFRAQLLLQFGAALLVWVGLVLLSFVLPYGETTQISLWLVGATLPLYAASSTAQTLFQAGERMELVMGTEIFVNTLILVFSLVILWRGGNEMMLIAVIVVAQVCSTAICLWLVPRSKLLAVPQEGGSVARLPLLRQAMPFLGLSLGDVLLQRMDILLLSIFAGPMVTGIYSAAYNVVRVLMKLVQSFWKALYPTLSRLHRQAQDQYERLARLGLRYGLLLLMPLATIGAAVANGLFALVFGPEYTASAVVFQILIWSAPLFLFENYAITLLMVERHPRSSLGLLALHIGVTAVALPLLTQRGGAQGAAWAGVLAGMVGATAGLWMLHHYEAPVQLQRLWGIFAAAAIAGIVAWLLPVPWLLQVAAGGAVYLLVCWLARALTAADVQTLRRTLAHRG